MHAQARAGQFGTTNINIEITLSMYWVYKMRDVEMRMLKWMCGHTKLDQIENEDLQKKVGGTIDYR